MNKRTRATNFKQDTKKRIRMRDGGCIFCQAGRWPVEDDYGRWQTDIAHIVNRSQGGLGMEENGVVACRNHHTELDNGNKGWRGEMQQFIEEYMVQQYPGWNRENLVYRKEGIGC